MNSETTIINYIDKRLENFDFGADESEGLNIDVMECKINPIKKSNDNYSRDEAIQILNKVRTHYQKKGYVVTFSNGFFSFFMHGNINIKKK